MPNALHIVERHTPRDRLGQLALLAGRGDRVLSVGPAPHGLALPVPVDYVHRPLGSATLAAPRVRRAADAMDADAVAAWSLPAARAGRAAAKARGCRLIVAPATAPCEDDAEGISLLRRLCRPGGAVTLAVPTQSSRGALADRGLASDCLAVLPPVAVPIDDADARRRRTREALGLAGDEVLLVAPAEMIRHAGHKYASWVHGILRQMLPHVRLMLPGSGPVEARVRFFADSTGYPGEVFFPGERFEAGDCLAAADLVLFLHHRDCGVGMLAAAMAAGKAIIACGTPDVAELIRHEQTGLLVPRRNPRVQTAAALRLIEDTALAERLGAAAADFAREHFALEAGRRRLEEILAAPRGA